MIQTRVETTPQKNMIYRVEQALARLLADASRRGFYGEAGPYGECREVVNAWNASSIHRIDDAFSVCDNS